MCVMSSELGSPVNKLQKYTLNPSFQSGLLNVDSEGTIIYANSSMLQILGLPAQEVLGNNLFSLLAKLLNKKKGGINHWEYPAYIYQSEAYLATQNFQGDELRLKVTTFEMADIGSAFIVDQCQEPPYQTPMDNVVIEQLPIPVISITADGKIIMLNRAFESLFQLQASTILGSPIAVFEGVFPELPGLLLDTLHNARPLTRLVDFRRSSLHSVIRVETKPITEWGKVIAAIACLHVYDNPGSVPESMPNHEAYNIISRLVEETAHRVRNPLTVVKGFIQLYRDKPENILWDLLLDEISKIEKTLQDLMFLSSEYRERREQVDLNHIIAELYPSIEANARHKGVWVELCLEPSRKVEVKGDADRIKALVNHLIMMFLYSMGEGELLTIQTKSSKDGAMLVLADSGDANQDLFHSVFNHPAQDRARRAEFSQTVCKHLVDSLRGSVHILRNKNHGNMVTVTIPHDTS